MDATRFYKHIILLPSKEMIIDVFFKDISHNFLKN